MSRRVQENLVAVLMLALFCGVVWLCQDFGPRARLIPLPLAIFGIVLTIVQLVWQNTRSLDDLQMHMISVSQPPLGAAADDAEAPSEGDPSPEKRVTAGRELFALGIVVLFIGLVVAIGLMPAVFVFTGGYFVVSRHYGWLAGLFYTSLFTGVIYLLFIVALQVPPYYGLLAPLVERLQ